MHRSRSLPLVLALALPLTVACRSGAGGSDGPGPVSPIPGAVPADDLIVPGEEAYFEHLWQLTFGGENAEAYWSFSGDRLTLQASNVNRGIDCDRIFVTQPGGGAMRQVSSGLGVTTCAYFMPDDQRVLYASTHAGHDTCPQRPRTEGYAWMVWPDYDIYVTSLEDLEERPLITGPGYDAEATESPRGDRIVFTSTRSGDLELWTSDLEGGDLRQVTDSVGYDGGAFFSHDGEWIVFRATEWTPGKEAEEQARYRDDLARWMVRPSAMEIYVIRPDGTDRRKVTSLGGANFAPFFHPNDERILFSSNHHSGGRAGLNFDLFSVRVDGTDLRQVTFFDGPPGKQFDAFPMFSPCGQYLAFSSNRGDGAPGETNVFIAKWKSLE